MNKTSIELNNISMTFGDKEVLRDFSYSFSSDCYVIKGESGIGKTTLLRIISGLQTPTSGSIKYYKDVSSSDKSKTLFSIVFQEDRLLNDLNAIQNISIVCPNVSINEIEANLLSIGLEKESLQKNVSELSGGMKRRVAIVRAVLAESNILIMDEPLSGLNPDLASSVTYYIQSKINKRLFIVASHSDLFDQFCKKINF